MEHDYELTLKDLPEGCRSLAEFMGMDRFLEFASIFAGETFYVPNLTQLRIDLRNEDIRSQYRNSEHNVSQLSRKYRLSERQIRNIIRK